MPLDTREPNLYVIGFVGGDQIIHRLLCVQVFVTEFEAVAVDGFEEQFLCAIVPVLVLNNTVELATLRSLSSHLRRKTTAKQIPSNRAPKTLEEKIDDYMVALW